MSIKTTTICRKFSMLLYFMLILQVAKAQKNFDKVDDWLQNNLEELGGRAVLLIYKDGKVIYTKSENGLSKRQKMVAKFIAKRQGKDQSEITEDLDPSSRLRIASCSKWLSAALVMTFVDEGKLNLDDSVGKYLPIMTANGKGNIKIWQCLSHLTGIKAGTIKESIDEMKEIKSMDEAIEKIAEQPMEGEPGKTFHYSSVGLQIAGAVIEKISGKSFETLFAERIAKPCDMKNTDFGKGKVALPAGGAFSTEEDYMNFLVMILHDGKYNGKQVVSRSLIIKMQQNYAKGAKVISSPAEAGSWGYGFGEWVMEEPNVRSQGVTSPGLFGSFPWVDNEKKYAGFLFCFNLKSKGRNERYKELKKLVDEAIEKK
ncbi:MAG TPA: serine hydrolase domain-containing protein [Chitinophagaceae bacterium]